MIRTIGMGCWTFRQATWWTDRLFVQAITRCFWWTKDLMSNEIVVNVRVTRLTTTLIITVTVTTARMATRVATGAAVFWGEVTTVSMIREVRFAITVWQQIGMTRGWRRRCMRFRGLCGLAHIVKNFGCLCTSGRVVHFTNSPFDSSLQKLHWLQICDRLASHHWPEQIRLQGQSLKWWVDGVVDVGMASSLSWGVKVTWLWQEDWPFPLHQSFYLTIFGWICIVMALKGILEVFQHFWV